MRQSRSPQCFQSQKEHMCWLQPQVEASQHILHNSTCLSAHNFVVVPASQTANVDGGISMLALPTESTAMLPYWHMCPCKSCWHLDEAPPGCRFVDVIALTDIDDADLTALRACVPMMVFHGISSPQSIIRRQASSRVICQKLYAMSHASSWIAALWGNWSRQAQLDRKVLLMDFCFTTLPVNLFLLSLFFVCSAFIVSQTDVQSLPRAPAAAVIVRRSTPRVRVASARSIREAGTATKR